MNAMPLALVTGGARRLGREISLHLAKKGYAIAVHFHSSEMDSRRLIDEIAGLGVPVFSIRADLRNPEELKNLFHTINELPYSLKVTINSAAIMTTSNLMKIETDDWDQIMNLNVRAVWLNSMESAKLMANGGVIINLSDVGSRKNWTRYGAYIVSKASVETLTRVMARQLAPKVRVCGIAPGLILQGNQMTNNEWQGLIEKTPLKKSPKPEDLMRVIDFLLENDYITGEVINLASGYQLI